MKRLKIGLAVAVLAGLTVISTASAGVFESSPNGCATGIYQGYCGTQEDGTGLYLAARGDTIIGTNNPGYGTSEDFFWFAFYGAPSPGANNKIAEFAPGGAASNLVMALVWNSGWAVELQPATGAPNQQWSYNGTGLTNVAEPGLVLQTNGNNNPVSMVTAPTVATPNQTFTFVEGQ